MKKQWVAEAVYIVVALLFIGLCIEENGKEQEVFGTSVTATPGAESGSEPGGNEIVGKEDLQGNADDSEKEPDGTEPDAAEEITSAPVQDTIPTPDSLTSEEENNPGGTEPEETGNMPGRIEIANETYEQYSNDKKAWWFQRNKSHKPSGSGEEFPINEYSAYYLDKQVTEEDKVMYLTFDCGYENGFTPAILDTLAEKDVKAMFFVTKDFIVKNPDYVKRMKEEGHLVGNHTVRHLSSPDLTPEELFRELHEVETAMEEKTGYPIDPFFRPPMGEYSERTLKVTQDMGYTSVFWSIAYYDYDVNDQPGKEYVTQHFTDYHHNGCIALLHIISESNTLALGEVVDLLKAEGYRLGALTELAK